MTQYLCQSHLFPGIIRLHSRPEMGPTTTDMPLRTRPETMAYILSGRGPYTMVLQVKRSNVVATVST